LNRVIEVSHSPVSNKLELRQAHSANDLRWRGKPPAMVSIPRPPLQKNSEQDGSSLASFPIETWSLDRLALHRDELNRRRCEPRRLPEPHRLQKNGPPSWPLMI